MFAYKREHACDNYYHALLPVDLSATRAYSICIEELNGLRQLCILKKRVVLEVLEAHKYDKLSLSIMCD